MSKTNLYSEDLLKLVFNNTALANVGDVTGIPASATVGSFYATLYTVAPSNTSNGTEATYTGYARVAVARTTGGWTVNAVDPIEVSNTADITFPASTSVQSIAGFGLAFTLTGDVKYWHPITLSVVNGTIPTIVAGQLKIYEE